MTGPSCWPADHPPASRAPLPHAYPRLFLEDPAPEALHQLAAGSARQLPRPPGLPRAHRQNSSSKSIWSPKWPSSTPSTSSSSPTPKTSPSPTMPRWPANCAPFCEAETAGPAARRLPRRQYARDSKRTMDFLVDLNQRLSAQIGYVIRLEPGVQTCEETLTLRHRLLPRFRLAAGPGPPPPRPRRPLCLRLSHPAHRRRKAARRPRRSHQRLHRPARLGRGLSPRRRLGRLRCHLRPAGRRRPHSPRLPRPTSAAPRPSPARSSSAKPISASP